MSGTMRNSSSSDPVVRRCRDLEMEAARRRHAPHEERSRLHMGRHGRKRRALDPYGEIAAHMRHQVAAHERSGKRMQRKPCRFDAARSQDDGARRIQGRNLRCPFTSTSIVWTVPPAVCSLMTCAVGTRNSRRFASLKPDAATSSRIASTSSGVLLNLSKLKSPEAGALPCTARGAGWKPLVPTRFDVRHRPDDGQRAVLSTS